MSRRTQKCQPSPCFPPFFWAGRGGGVENESKNRKIAENGTIDDKPKVAEEELKAIRESSPKMPIAETLLFVFFLLELRRNRNFQGEAWRESIEFESKEEEEAKRSWAWIKRIVDYRSFYLLGLWPFFFLLFLLPLSFSFVLSKIRRNITKLTPTENIF